MIESNSSNEESSVAALLAKRNELDIKIRKEHTKSLTVFFCDIKGYTSYTETHGDLASRALCKQMTDIAFPAIEEFDGHLVKTIGDAIMAYFIAPEQAVRFSVALLQRLKTDNESRPATNQVILRIGMHYGEAIVDAGDLYGDSVNIAARIEPQAKPNGILISPSLFHKVQQTQDIICVYAKEIMMKGKAEPIKLYQVIWDGDRHDDYSADKQAQNVNQKTNNQVSPLEKKGWSLTTKLAVALTTVAVVVVFLKISFPNESSQRHKTIGNNATMSVVDPYADGYAALRKGEMFKSANLFKKIKHQDPTYKEAMAALSYWQNDFDDANRFTSEALAIGGDRIFPHVIDGNLKLRQAKYTEASTAFQKGSIQEKGFPWQKAQAFNGLARISSIKGEWQDALAHYQKAASFESDDSEILTNQGVLLEKLGRDDEAVAAYQKAVTMNPKDELALRLLHISQQREKSKLDSDKQEKINKLVEDLSIQFKNGNVPKKEAPNSPTETTLPLTAWFIGFDEKGDVPKRDGEKDVFADLLTQNLQDSGIIEFVERSLLDKLLAELKLGSSELADQSTSLRLGRLLSAKLLIHGSIFRKSGKTVVSVKVVETETSRIKGSVTFIVAKGDGLFSSVDTISEQISQKLGFYRKKVKKQNTSTEVAI